MERQFVALKRDKYNSRLDSIMNAMGLTDRLVTIEHDGIIENNINYSEPSQTNAHPHVSGNCTRSGSGTVESEVVGVHNGIIENYTELKEKLLKHGYTFYSQTDTEVVIKLVDYYYKKYNLGPIDGSEDQLCGREPIRGHTEKMRTDASEIKKKKAEENLHFSTLKR